jgi:hypothetical protein
MQNIELSVTHVRFREAEQVEVRLPRFCVFDGSSRSGFGESATTAASGEPSAAATATVARDGMTATPTAGAHSAAVATATATAAAKSTPAAMAHEDEGTVIGGTHSVL